MVSSRRLKRASPIREFLCYGNPERLTGADYAMLGRMFSRAHARQAREVPSTERAFTLDSKRVEAAYRRIVRTVGWVFPGPIGLLERSIPQYVSKTRLYRPEDVAEFLPLVSGPDALRLRQGVALSVARKLWPQKAKSFSSRARRLGVYPAYGHFSGSGQHWIFLASRRHYESILMHEYLHLISHSHGMQWLRNHEAVHAGEFLYALQLGKKPRPRFHPKYSPALDLARKLHSEAESPEHAWRMLKAHYDSLPPAST